MPWRKSDDQEFMATLTSEGQPTLKTIARISGLAVPTVSRALNDAPDISRNTKIMVRRIASEIGYVPNRAGVRLRTGRTHVISLVMSTEMDLMNHSARLIASVAQGLRETPYHLNITPFFPDQDPVEPVRHIVESGAADAIILNQTTPEDPRISYLMARGFPFATHGRTQWAAQHAYYEFDNKAYGEIAVAQLARRGRKHLLLIAPDRSLSYAIDMIAGVKAAAAAHGLRVTLAEGVASDTVASLAVQHIRRLLSADPSVDGMITASTTSAMAAARAAAEEGATLGDTLDVFAKEAVPFLQIFRTDILTIAEDVGAAGAFLAKAAMQAIRDADLPPMQALEVPTDTGQQNAAT